MPFKSEITEVTTFNVDGNLVILAERLDEVLKVFGSIIFNTKVVNTEGKENGSTFVAPDTIGGFEGVITVAGKTSDQLLVGKNCCLFQIIDTFFYLTEDITVGVNKLLNLVGLEKFR